MTLDELEKFLFDTLAPSLEEAWRKGEAAERKLAEKDRDLEEERKARKAAEKDAADREKENPALRKALEDERDRNKTHVRNKFGSSRRRSFLIEMCKLWKVSVCEYLNKIYTAFSVGRTDYDNLMPWCMASFS